MADLLTGRPWDSRYEMVPRTMAFFCRSACVVLAGEAFSLLCLPILDELLVVGALVEGGVWLFLSR